MAKRDDGPSPYHTYESSAVPRWIVVMWACFFVFGFTYLLVSLLD